MSRFITAAFAAVSVLFPAPPAGAGQFPKTAAPQLWQEAETDEDGDFRIVVIQRQGASGERAALRLERRAVARRAKSFDRIGGDVVKVPRGRLAEVLAELEADPDVEAAAPDRRDQRVAAQTVPWGVERIHADPVSRGKRSGAGVKVAVIDTGIWAAAGGGVHPELAAAYRGGYDFVNGDPFPWDDHGHGTHVAGIIAATDNADGVVGVAPGVGLYALKVLAADGSGYYSDFISALDWCIANGIKVVNYSAGGTEPWAPMAAACNRARDAGITVVAAAGNNYGGPLLYPAAYGSVVSVGATDFADQRADFSNVGVALDLVAPGDLIESTFLGGDYTTWSGTSMATPHVAGAAALLASRAITEPRLVQEYLQATAADLGVAGHDPQYGHGRVDAGAALPAGPKFLAPLAGEVVPSGTPFPLSWEPVAGATSYRLLFAAGASSSAAEIAASTAATSTTWLPPAVGAPLTTGRLQVAAYDAGGRLLSVGTRLGFSVRSLRVTAPAAGASLVGGAPLWLRWEVYATSRPVAAIAVDLSEDGGKSWTRLRSLGAARRSFAWTPPPLTAERPVRLRVVLRDAGGAAISNAAVAFRVVPAGS